MDISNKLASKDEAGASGLAPEVVEGADEAIESEILDGVVD